MRPKRRKMGTTSPWGRGHHDLDPEKKLLRLRSRFSAVSRQIERPARIWRNRIWWTKVFAAATLGAAMTFDGLSVSPWPAALTLRHLASFPNCDAARFFELAPSRRGNPGYWLRHDRDKDGWACEPYP